VLLLERNRILVVIVKITRLKKAVATIVAALDKEAVEAVAAKITTARLR
jgi:hypothetical protein